MARDPKVCCLGPCSTPAFPIVSGTSTGFKYRVELPEVIADAGELPLPRSSESSSGRNVDQSIVSGSLSCRPRET